MSNVYSLVANKTGYQNVQVTNIPLTNLSGTYPGPLNQNRYVPFVAPNMSAVGAGGGSVFVSPTLNVNLTSANAPAPMNLTMANKTVPASGYPSSSAPAPTKSSGARINSIAGGPVVWAFLAAVAGSTALFA
jgi:hypothetical protein